MTACPKPTPRPKRAKIPIPRVNQARAAKRYERDFGEKGDLIRRQKCCCTNRFSGDWITDDSGKRVQVVVVAAHFPGRGAGGRAKDIIPLAGHLHTFAHTDKRGHRWLEQRYGVDFKQVAVYWESVWQRELAARTP